MGGDGCGSSTNVSSLRLVLLTDSGVDQSEAVAELLKELSNHSERVEERKAALCELMKLIRDTRTPALQDLAAAGDAGGWRGNGHTCISHTHTSSPGHLHDKDSL